MQAAVNVMLEFTTGVALDAARVHDTGVGGGDADCQLTLMVVGALALVPLLAATE